MVTCIDGYQMARQGRAGAALGMSAFGSFIGGTLGVLAVMLVSLPSLAEAALKFGAPETLLSFLRLYLYRHPGGNPSPGASHGGWGCCWALWERMKSTAWTASPSERFTCVTESGWFLWPWASSAGRDFSDLRAGDHGLDPAGPQAPSPHEGRLEAVLLVDYPRQRLSDSGPARDRRGRLGSLSHAVEKRVSKHPERFGPASRGWRDRRPWYRGHRGGFVPLLTLGIPTNSVLALLLAALMLHGVTPGPLLLLKPPKSSGGSSPACTSEISCSWS